LKNMVVTIADWECLAKERLSEMAFAYLAGGAGDEFTLRGNREGFDRIRLRPSMLVDVSEIDTTTTLFGQTLRLPVLLAPVAYQKLIHPDGELESVRGANAAGVIFTASTSASTAVEDIAREATVRPWFQLYASSDRSFTKALVDRAYESGCTVLCFTVDAPVRGQRDRDMRCGFRLPPGMERPNFRDLSPQALTGNPHAAGRSIYSPNLDPKLTWSYLDWLRSVTSMPIVLKGILTAEDTVRALEAGVDGILVSNHGGRVIDTVIPSIEALPEVVEAVAGRVPVLLDGGVRRGTDVLKAIALGAAAVMIGRPYLFALAVQGADGVYRCVDMLHREIEMAMAACGRPTIASIDRSVVKL
jgi:4-hydroxymandelate oxidase